MHAMEPFQQLGKSLKTRWLERKLSLDVFPELARNALLEFHADRHVEAMDILRWTLQTDPLPIQADLKAAFGQPPVTLYLDDVFSIAALFWLDGTTEIHQHSFSGAFMVLTGSSVHSQYSFDLKDAINERLQLGDLRWEKSELLSAGDVRVIESGRRFIHALFHLDRPSVSVVVRTHQDRSSGLQYSYQRPGVAYHPFKPPPTLLRRLQCARVLLETQAPDTVAALGKLIASSDPYAAWKILTLADESEYGRRISSQICEIGSKRHGPLLDALMAAIEEARFQKRLVLRRRTVHEAEHRFFLALLMNVPSRDRILDLIRQRLPDRDPVDSIIGWIRDLSEKPPDAQAAGPKSDAPGIGLVIDEGALWVVRRLLLDRTEADITAELRSGRIPEGVSISESEVRKLCFLLPHTSLFRPLLGDPAGGEGQGL